MKSGCFTIFFLQFFACPCLFICCENLEVIVDFADIFFQYIACGLKRMITCVGTAGDVRGVIFLPYKYPIS